MSATRPLHGYNWLIVRLIAALAGGCMCALLAQPAHAQTEPITNTLFIPLLPAGRAPGSTLYLPLVTGSELPPPQSEPVFGVVGQVRPGAAGGAQFVTPNGRTFGLVGATPDISAELTRLAARTSPADARIWGTLYRSVETPTAFIVVTQLVVDEEITPTPTPRATAAAPTPTRTGTPTRVLPLTPPSPMPVSSATPMSTPTVDSTPPAAVGRFESVNLRSSPGPGDERSGTLYRGQECDIVGQTADGAWLKLDCPGGSGWIEPHLVTTQGNLAAVPEVTPEPTATPTPTPTITPTPSATPVVYQGWRTLFYNNPQLQGVPLAAQDEPSLNFSRNWGTGVPYPGLPADFFSVSYDRTVNLPAGFYFITVQADDWVRIYLDGQRIIDQSGGAPDRRIRVGWPLGGQHTLRIEYTEISGDARVSFVLEPAPPPMRWTVTYSGLADETGQTPFSRREPDGGQYPLDYDWGRGSPTVSPAEGWGGTWSGSYSFAGGNYTFRALTEDAVRLYLDNNLVLDRWSDGNVKTQVENTFIGLGPGEHTVEVRYFNSVGDASLRVWWMREVSGGFIPE